MTDEISETVSTNRRRGRPRVFDAATFARLRAGCAGTTLIFQTGRCRTAYQYTAQGLLEGKDWARWLIDPKGIMQGRRRAYRKTIMQELGASRMLTFWLKWPGSSARQSRPPRTPCG